MEAFDCEEIQRLGIALTPGIDGDVFQRIEAAGINSGEFYKLSNDELDSIMSGHRVPDTAVRNEALARAKVEMEFMHSHNVKCRFCTDRDYPIRLMQLSDAPAVIFMVGADVDFKSTLSVVGTRQATPYGLHNCEQIVSRAAELVPGIVIVSGLAYGIDVCAHTAAINAGTPTVAVVAHGLDMIYPAVHRDLARRIVQSGGAIMTQYPTKTRPYRRRFLDRNRIVAALADATIVIESSVRGGALSTANAAHSLGHRVFAVPGRITDEMSGGCNALIANNKAHLFTTVESIAKTTGWVTGQKAAVAVQGNLFPEISADLMPVYEVLKKGGDVMPFDKIMDLAGMTADKVLSALSDLEFEGLVLRHPGNRYSVS